MAKYAFGIDLGTTNSCIAVKTANTPAQIITLADGNKTLPSCVMYKDGTITVGHEAYEHRYDTKHVVYSSKRDIGSDKSYTVYANGDDQPPIHVTPVDVAAEILKKLKHDAELLYGEGFIKDVTITVPAYFTMARRAATIEAAKHAGLNVLSLINEPTAAAIAYTEGKSANEKILVYDLGGGTFDVTLLDMLEPDNTLADLFDESTLDSSMAKVITSSGDSYLGGDDLDRMTVEYALKDPENGMTELQTKSISSVIEPVSLEHAILLVEQIKKSNSIDATHRLTVNLLDKVDEQRAILIKKQHFMQAFQDIYAKTLVKLRECLIGFKTTDISKLILIGGSTKFQPLREALKSDFSRTNIYLDLNPDEAVALGAAVNSSIIIGETNMTVSDILPQSIGIEITSVVGDQKFEGRYYKLIPKNTALPATIQSLVTTSEPYQRRATVPIYQGEDLIAANNTHVSSIILDLEPSENIQDISVLMTIDASGVLHITLEAGSKVTSATIQSVLKPNTQNRGMQEKIATRYRYVLSKHKDDPRFEEGKRLIDKFSCGEITLAELKKFFQELTAESTKQAEEAVMQSLAETTNLFTQEETDYEDSEDEEDSDEE